MRRVEIRIGEPAPGGGYPITLGVGPVDGPFEETLEGSIPAAGELAPPVEDPDTGDPLTLATVGPLFQTELEASPRFRAIGTYLFRLLDESAIGNRWRECRQQGCRTLLDLRTEQLRALPWELLYDPATPAGQTAWLFLRVNQPIVRGRIDPATAADPINWPIRALVVVGADPNDTRIRVVEEVTAVAAALRAFGPTLDLEILAQPSALQLLDKLERWQPDLLHFIGHGGRTAQGDAALFFDGASPGWNWDTGTIEAHLQLFSPRFVFLNACRTAQAGQVSGAVRQAQAALADVFAAHAPAVIGTLTDIGGEAAAELARRVYEALALRKPLDAAVTTARIMVNARTNRNFQNREWAVASLRLAVHPERVLALQPEVSDQLRGQVDQLPEFQPIQRFFVARSRERRDLWQGVHPPAEGQSNLLVVTGESEIGKTWLVHWLLRGCAWRQERILYVDVLNGPPQVGTKRILEVLYQLSHPCPHRSELLCGSTSIDWHAFDAFPGQLRLLLEQGAPQVVNPLPDGPWPGTFDWRALPWDDTHASPQLFETLLAAFRDTLCRAAGPQPLLIVLDHPAVHLGHFRHLKDHLLQPIAQGQLEHQARIKVILVADDRDYRELELSSLRNYGGVVNVDVLERDLSGKILSEFLSCHGLDAATRKLVLETFGSVHIQKPRQLHELVTDNMLTLWRQAAAAK